MYFQKLISDYPRVLVNDFKPGNMVCYTCLDGVIYKQEVDRLCWKEQNRSPTNIDTSVEWRSVLLLMPVRLGIATINPIYISVLKMCLSLPQSVGIAGGKSNASLYFIGHEGSRLLLLNQEVTD